MPHSCLLKNTIDDKTGQPRNTLVVSEEGGTEFYEAVFPSYETQDVRISIQGFY